MICAHCGHEAAAPKAGITENQRQLLDYIKTYMGKNKGCAPSYEEMRKAMMKGSKSGIHGMLAALVARGHLGKLPGRGRARAITVL